MTGYCRESESLTVYHIGGHKCPLKPDTNKYRKQVRNAVLRNSGLVACGNLQAKVGQAAADGEMREAWRRAMELSYTSIMSKKARVAHKRSQDKHCLEAVGILKQDMDKVVKYLIYKINNSQFNGQPNYVFKSSPPMAQLAIDMYQDGPEHPLQGEEAYLMTVTPNVLDIKLLHYLSTIQPCSINLVLLIWRLTQAHT